eukprot:GHVU01041759.1.p3 GENE.GHVU01041759.1~~GHVU01041759.1.p3  ORF type:complete len:114 (+),score=12.22 GHVU01041759.1:280-621(+)
MCTVHCTTCAALGVMYQPRPSSNDFVITGVLNVVNNEGVAMKKENAGDTSRAGDASLCASFRGRELRGSPLPLGDTAGVCAYLSSVQTEEPSSSDQKRKKESGDDRCAMQVRW